VESELKSHLSAHPVTVHEYSHGPELDSGRFQCTSESMQGVHSAQLRLQDSAIIK
jgi:hypothetical protein